MGRHIWPGMFTSRIGAPSRDYAPQEIVQQIDIARSRPGSGGHVHFSMVALMENRKGISDQLAGAQYAQPALVPASPWLGGAGPAAPKVSASKGGRLLKLKLAGGTTDGLYAVWSRYGTEWRFSVVPSAQQHALVVDDAKLGEANAVFVSAVDRIGNESERVRVWPKG
jgi:hypothetical protein